jgi:hypothetical protein
MSHLVSRQPWGVVDLDTIQGRVFVQQDWYYTWHTIAPATAWTVAEKRAFHRATDRSIWARWSNRIRLHVAGAGTFCRTFAASGVPINFDVRWKTRAGQWHVNAYKTPPGTAINTYHQSVDFAARVIELYTSKLPPYEAANDAGISRPGFISTPHEFGHALGNDDEYVAGSIYLADDASTMNVGSQIRSRHLTLVLATLNGMLPGAVFSM